MDSQIDEDKLMLFDLRINWKKFDDQTKESIRSVIEKALSLTQRQSFICNDIWFDVFEFFGRAELGLLMARLSKRFNALVDSHFSMTLVPHLTFDDAVIRRAEDGTGAVLKVRKKKVLFDENEMQVAPMDSISFQKSIKKIHEMTIRYIDRSVLNFLRGIKHALESHTHFEMRTSIKQQKSWDVIIKKIWPLMPMSDCDFITSYPQTPYYAWNDFPVSLLDCAELRIISCAHLPMPYAVVDDAFHRTNVALFNWLHLPRADGRPKYFHWCSELDANESIKQLKEKFINDTSPVNYFVNVPKKNYRSEDESLNSRYDYGQSFVIVNEKTQELLKLLACGGCWTLIRNQISWDWQNAKKRSYAGRSEFIIALRHDKHVDLE